jgi:hypothetical protein
MSLAGVETLVRRVQPSVVVVSFSDRDGTTLGIGSGVIVGADGLIATNLHVLGEARPVRVRLFDGRSFDVTQVFAHEKSQDLALIRIDAGDLPALELGDSDALQPGQSVVALGNPQGLEHSVVTGVVSALRKDVEGMSMIQLAIPIERGNSGGPVVDADGRVVGLLTLKSLVTDNLGYAVAINSLKPLLENPNPIAMSKWLTIGALNPKHWQVIGDARWTQRSGRLRSPLSRPFPSASRRTTGPPGWCFIPTAGTATTASIPAAANCACRGSMGRSSMTGTCFGKRIGPSTGRGNGTS